MDGLLVGRIRGIEIRLHWSLLAVVLLLTWSLAEVVFPDMEPGYSTAQYWTAGFFASCALFGSLLGHELGHSFAAHREGISVRRTSLWLFGGLAELESEPTTPLAGFRVAVMGPIVSIVAGAAGVVASLVVTGLAGTAIFWFGVANLSLAVFNLIPAYPLDGGRIYQAWQWHKTGDPIAATRNAAAVGLVVGALLIMIGIFQTLAGASVGGVWLMLIGLIIRDAARREHLRSRSSGAMSTIQVQHIMTRDPRLVHPDLHLDEFIATIFFGGRHAAYPVGTSPTDIHGIVTLNSVRNQPPDRLSDLRVAEVMTPLGQVLTTDPQQPMTNVLSLTDTGRGTRALVFEGSTLVGIVSPSDVARMVSVVEIAGPSLDIRDPGPLMHGIGAPR